MSEPVFYYLGLQPGDFGRSLEASGNPDSSTSSGHYFRYIIGKEAITRVIHALLTSSLEHCSVLNMGLHLKIIQASAVAEWDWLPT